MFYGVNNILNETSIPDFNLMDDILMEYTIAMELGLNEYSILFESSGGSILSKIKSGFRLVGNKIKELFSKFIGIFNKDSKKTKEDLKKAKDNIKNMSSDEIREKLKMNKHMNFRIDEYPKISEVYDKIQSHYKKFGFIELRVDFEYLDKNYKTLREKVDTYTILQAEFNGIVFDKSKMNMEELKAKLEKDFISDFSVLGTNITQNPKAFGIHLQEHEDIINSLDRNLIDMKKEYRVMISKINTSIKEISRLESELSAHLKTSRDEGRKMGDDVDDDTFNKVGNKVNVFKMATHYADSLGSVERYKINTLMAVYMGRKKLLKKQYGYARSVIQRFSRYNPQSKE